MLGCSHWVETHFRVTVCLHVHNLFDYLQGPKLFRPFMIFLNPNQFDEAIEFFVETIFQHL
jgi:hypothetical protein